MTSSALVSLRYARRLQQQVTALQNFNLDTAAGGLVALVGGSGYGKSMLPWMLVGLESATQGDICISDELVTGVGEERGVVFQEPRLFPWLNVLDNVMLGLADEKSTRAMERQRALEMLARVQFSELASMPPAQFSGGMTQWVAIARGLTVHPQILMLDEPFGTLSTLTHHTLQQEFLQVHQSAGIITLLVTHGIEETIVLADRTVVFSPCPGRIRGIVSLMLPHPRQHDNDSFTAACRHIRDLIISV